MKDFYQIQITESSPTEPVTLQEVKDFAVIDFEDDDDLLSAMITTAREDIEQRLNWKLVEATAEAYVWATCAEQIFVFPHTLNLSHVTADSLIVSKLYDGLEDEVLTIDEEYFFNSCLKLLGSGQFKIEYGITPIVPNSVKEAIKMLVAYRYNNRSDQDKQGFPEDVEAKISKYRQIYI